MLGWIFSLPFRPFLWVWDHVINPTDQETEHQRLLRDIHAIKVRTERASDERRIWTMPREELKGRIVKGTPPPATMLAEVAPTWGKKSAAKAGAA